MKFRLRACLQSQVELLAVGNHLLHHGAHLIGLDGIDDEILAFVAILHSRLLEAARDFLNAVVQNVGESQ